MSMLNVSSSPHIRAPLTTNRIMLDVVLALLPASVAGVIIFGMRAALVLCVCVLAAVASEFLFNVICKKKQTIGDLSAVVTGLLLGLNLHANSPIWQCALGSVFAIIVVKCLFGGLGCNFANPAITARIFLFISFAGDLAGGAAPIRFADPELVSGATPLAVIGSTGSTEGLPGLLDMFLGLRGGAIGETCILALLVGFAYLVLRGIIKFEVPIIMVGTVFALALMVSGSFSVALYHVLSGGLVLGAVFMATDYVTTPITRTGKMIFAFGCGLITFLIRHFGNYPEGVSFSILLMNILSPYIEKWTERPALGGKK